MKKLFVSSDPSVFPRSAHLCMFSLSIIVFAIFNIPFFQAWWLVLIAVLTFDVVLVVYAASLLKHLLKYPPKFFSVTGGGTGGWGIEGYAPLANPSTGLPMVGDDAMGFDTGGNAFGSSSCSSDFD